MKLFHLVPLALLTAFAFAQANPTPHHEPNFDSERNQADDLYAVQKPLEALPFYEDLSRQDPRLPFSLSVKARVEARVISRFAVRVGVVDRR